MSNFVNNILKLVSGSIIAQVLGFLIYPIITRMYLPEDFGTFQLFISISSVLAIISCLSYQVPIMLPKSDEDSANIVALCVILIISFSIISGFVFTHYSNQIGNILNTPELCTYMRYVPIIIFLNGLFFVLNSWLARRVKFGSVATSRVFNSLSSKLIQVGMGINKPSAIGLIFGYISGYLIANAVMLKSLKSDVRLFKNISYQNIKKVAIRYKRFPRYSLMAQLINTSSFQLIPFMLAYFFSSTVVGHYSLANQLLVLPMILIGNATDNVFFQRASEMKNKTGNIKDILSGVHRRLISIGLFPTIVFMIIGEDIFSLFLGSNWYTSGIYAKILAPWVYLRFIYFPLSSIFDILEKQNLELYFNIATVIAIFVSLYVGGSYGNPITSLILLSTIGVLLWGSANLYILKISEVKFAEEARVFIKYLSIALLVSTPLIVIKYFSLPTYTIFIATGISALIYYLIVIHEDITLRNELYKAVKIIKYKLRFRTNE